MISNLPSNQYVQLPGVPQGATRTLTNVGNTTVYYGRDSQVSSTHNSGSLAPGASVSLGYAAYLISVGGQGEVDDEISDVAVEQDQQISSSSVAALMQSIPGLWLPPDWGQFWKPKRDAARTAKAVLACVGDSVHVGLYASNFNTKGMFGLVASALQSRYGDGGSGFKSSHDSNAVMTALGLNATAISSYAGKGCLIGQTGSWSSGQFTGPPGGNVLTSSTAGSTLTFTVRGTSVSVLYYLQPSNATFTWTIDGVSQTPVNTAGAAAGGRVTVSGLSAGNHTVVITAPGTNPIWIAGCSGENTTGVVCNNFSLSGAQSAGFNDGNGVIGWSGGRNYPADCVIYALGINDATASITGDAWEKNVRAYLNGVKETTNGATDLIIVLPHIGTGDTSQVTYQDYAIRARGLAEAYGAALLNHWRTGRNSWQYWNTLGYWSVDDGSGGAGNDNVHLSDAGHVYAANQLLPILTAA